MNQRFWTAAIAAGCLLFAGQAFAQDKTDAEKPAEPDPKVLQAIVDAFAGGLPEKWGRAWVVVAEEKKEGGTRDFRVRCLFAVRGGDRIGTPIPSCDQKAVFENVFSLNRNIPSREKRRWTSATLIFMPDGKFELKYEYDEGTEKTEKPAADKSNKTNKTNKTN